MGVIYHVAMHCISVRCCKSVTFNVAPLQDLSNKSIRQISALLELPRTLQTEVGRSAELTSDESQDAYGGRGVENGEHHRVRDSLIFPKRGHNRLFW